MTGILRVAKEGIFSGLNNLKAYSILDNQYSQYFGFTHDEAEFKYDELCCWYDGYLFGNTSILNPWSVIGYFSNECIPQPHWVSTSSNDIISEMLKQADDEILQRLQELLTRLLQQSASHYDTAEESFFQGLVLGLCTMTERHYFVTSNRESGEGRFDIQLMPRNDRFPGILIEIKVKRETGKRKKRVDIDGLRKLSEDALQQIDGKNYADDMRMRGVRRIIKYRVAFIGKKAEVVCEVEEHAV